MPVFQAIPRTVSGQALPDLIASLRASVVAANRALGLPDDADGVTRLRARLAANPMPPHSTDHLHDPDLLQRLTPNSVFEDAGESPNLSEPARGTRRPSLTNAIRAAKAVGMTVSGATITPNGSVVLTFGDGSSSDSDNPWDRVLKNAPH